MSKSCDNKSVGILVWKDSDLLMIERKKYNFGFAIPAGHLDGLDPFLAAKKELSEEVGLDAEVFQERLVRHMVNPCKRDGGTYHEWTVVEASRWDGGIRLSEDETKSYVWANRDDILNFSKRLEKFAKIHGVEMNEGNLSELVRLTNEDKDWMSSPGLEPPMYFLFKELNLL